MSTKAVDVVLVTGGSSGIGAATVKMLAQEGKTVYAASRRGTVPEGVSGKVFPIVMDVTDVYSVNGAVAKILEAEGRIDAVVCNAGNGIAGPVEQTSVEEGKYQFETCFWGAHNVIKAVLPSMRENSFGKIITISSVAALVPIPFQTFYSAVKSSVLIYTKALSLEVKPYGIQCCSVLPGDTKTGFTSARKFTAESQNESAYTKRFKTSVSKMEEDEKSGMPPAKIASAICKQLNKKRMNPTSTPRADYKFFSFLVRILPTKLMLWIDGLLYG
ncbi:MAG: SDR family NAD(P)-dependent oxidoreductase [Bacteroidales bacterium]|nr:SDR family NAD(P)-dependent oxidoreductase [Bacteroidales bacterium]